MKISLAINTRNTIHEWMEHLLSTAKGFDEIVVYADGVEEMDHFPWASRVFGMCDGESRSVVDGFNLAVSNATGDWVCAFCDDDYFLEDNLSRLIAGLRAGEFEDADIIHFPVLTGSGRWGATPEVTFESLRAANHLPMGSFYRKSVFYALNGYQVEVCDWDFWLRAIKRGYRFKYFPDPVYFFRQDRQRSLSERQIRQHGFGALRAKVLQNAEKELGG